MSIPHLVYTFTLLIPNLAIMNIHNRTAEHRAAKNTRAAFGFFFGGGCKHKFSYQLGKHLGKQLLVHEEK